MCAMKLCLVGHERVNRALLRALTSMIATCHRSRTLLGEDHGRMKLQNTYLDY